MNDPGCGSIGIFRHTAPILLLALAFGMMGRCESQQQKQVLPTVNLSAPSESPISLTAGDLTAIFADNEAFGPVHRNRYNGIASLTHRSATENLFVPEYAGFNLEHFFGGDFLEELFEPREHPMVLTRLDDQTVRLYQPPPPRSQVETIHEFRMVPPHFIDVSVKIILHDLSPFPHGYAGLFWASYIHQPESLAIHFRGTSLDNPQPHWIEAISEAHGVKSSHLFIGDRFEPFYAPNFNTTLASHFSDYRYVEPFYFGRKGKMVYAIFFDRTEGIRFSQSPTGGGTGNPAWDHHLLIRDPKIGVPYSYRSRLVYKTFTSAEDIRKDYREWSNELENGR